MFAVPCRGTFLRFFLRRGLPRTRPPLREALAALPHALVVLIFFMRSPFFSEQHVRVFFPARRILDGIEFFPSPHRLHLIVLLVNTQFSLCSPASVGGPSEHGPVILPFRPPDCAFSLEGPVLQYAKTFQRLVFFPSPDNPSRSRPMRLVKRPRPLPPSSQSSPIRVLTAFLLPAIHPAYDVPHLEMVSEKRLRPLRVVDVPAE